jgi:hypothetical protein
MTAYTQRPHAFSPERTYALGPEDLTWKDDKSEGRLAYADFTEVRLAYAPTRVQKNRFLLTLVGKQGKPLQISNASYRSLADFEDRSLGYSRFVVALHRAVAVANPGVRFVSGNTRGQYTLNGLMAAFAVAVMVAGLVFFIAFGLVWVALIKMGLMAYYLPSLLRYLGRNRPCNYDPANIPPEMLPAMEGEPA